MLLSRISDRDSHLAKPPGSYFTAMVTTQAQSRTKPMIKIDLDTPCQLKYFQEGAAYVAYSIGDPVTSSSFNRESYHSGPPHDHEREIDPRLKNKLLRLRTDIPSAAPVQESHEYFKKTVEPLFSPGMLIEQELVEVSPELLKKRNADLRGTEKLQWLRDDDRAGTYLAEDETHGLLVTDMRWDDRHASCDLKPKWLAQSPSAPEGSKRCRTCAMRAKYERFSYLRAFCPLVLTTKNDELLKKQLLNGLCKMRGAPISMFEQVDYAIPFLKMSHMLRRLKDLQEEYDKDGPLTANVNNENFKLAMTLRDCTMFMKVSLAQYHEAQLADCALVTDSYPREDQLALKWHWATLISSQVMEGKLRLGKVRRKILLMKDGTFVRRRKSQRKAPMVSIRPVCCLCNHEVSAQSHYYVYTRLELATLGLSGFRLTFTTGIVVTYQKGLLTQPRISI